MMLTLKEIEDSMPWTPEVEISTKRGPRMLRKGKGEPTPEFWALWRTKKAEMVALGVSPRLNEGRWEVAWWREVPRDLVAKREANLELSRATDADIDIPSPEGMVFLPYQRAGIKFALDKEGTLIGDEMGLGKTIQAIGVINALPKAYDILIICPCKLKINWYRELRAWLARSLSIAIVDSQCFPSAQIVIINYDIVHKFQARLEARYWDLIIVDEAHYLKSQRARRTKAIVGYTPTRKEREGGMEPSSGIPCRKKICMTGTPICNRPIELYPLVAWLNREVWGNWWQYVRRYCGGHRESIGSETITKSDGATNLDELQTRLRESVMIRRLKKDVLKDLPPKRRQIVLLQGEGLADALEAEGAVLAEYETTLARLKARVELAKASDDEAIYKMAVEELQKGVRVSFEQISIVRHQTALAKVPLVKEHIEEALEELDKIIVYAYHRDVIDKMEQAFKGAGALKIYGGMSSVETQRVVDRFQNDPFYKVLILSIPVAVGMTLTAASHGFFCELDWTPGGMSQAEDRMHRIGQKESVNIYHLVLEGSLDCNMAETLIHKQDIIDRALDRVKAEGEAHEPVVPTREKSLTFTRDQIAKQATKITGAQANLIHDCLKLVAGVCNGARTLDAMGFSKIDANIGRSLAESLFISPKQAVIGQRLVWKYRRQIPEDKASAALEGFKNE